MKNHRLLLSVFLLSGCLTALANRTEIFPVKAKAGLQDKAKFRFGLPGLDALKPATLPVVPVQFKEPLHKTENTEKFNLGRTVHQTNSAQVKALVKDAAALVMANGQKAFTEFRKPGSRWRRGDTYIYVLDTEGNMLVHADADLEGKNQLELKDGTGRPIIRGLLAVTQADPKKPEGWHHYQWTASGSPALRWKSSFTQLVQAPDGKTYLVGSGLFTDRMEKEFVVDAVKNAVAIIEKQGAAAFPEIRDPNGPFLVRDAYILVVDSKGVELVNPAFQTYEGKNVLDLKDTQGKQFIREMLKVAEKSGSGWVNYQWPKPGETAASEKSTYVSKARLGDTHSWVLVGCGVYLDEASKKKAMRRK